MGGTRPGRGLGRKLTQREASEVLGISVEAVRKRIKRGTLDSEKGEDGRRYVYLDADRDESRPESEIEGRELVEELRDRVAFLQRELERKDAILLNMTEAMKALNPPPSEAPPESPVSPGPTDTPPEAPAGQEESSSRPEERRIPWWRRIFGE